MTTAPPLTLARRQSTEMRAPLSTANTPRIIITRPLPASSHSVQQLVLSNGDTLDMKRFSLTHSILCALFHALLALDHQMLRHIDQHATAPDRLCSASPAVRPSHIYHANKRLRREVSFAGNDDKNAAYLNGTVGLRLRTTATEQNSVSETDGLLAKLRQTFTVQVWVKIEGGQVDPATIICKSTISYPLVSTLFSAVADVCVKDENVIVWQLGIGSSDGVGERESRLFFALHTEMAPRPTRLTSHAPFHLNQWLKLTVTYDGARMHFYVNGGRVGRTEQQVHRSFSKPAAMRSFLGRSAVLRSPQFLQATFPRH
jgi:hypothetical protein